MPITYKKLENLKSESENSFRNVHSEPNDLIDEVSFKLGYLGNAYQSLCDKIDQANKEEAALFSFLREMANNTVHIGGTDYRINEKIIERANDLLNTQ